ncbi:MAG: hypothetical protein ABW203_08585 [Novosphingobium sp.]
MTFLPLALAAAALAAPSPASTPPALPTQTAPRLGSETRAELTCAAAFAITASEQQRGVESALAYPSLGVRGKEFFVRAGARAIDEAKIDRDAVRGLLEAEVARLQQEAMASGAPDKTMAAIMPGCLARLDASVAKLARPTLGQCAAIMQLGYEEVHGREGLTPRAQDLKTLANVLESREREAMAAKGAAPPAIDRAVIENHDRMLVEAQAEGPGVEKYDIQLCYDFAKPDETKHY